MKTNAAYRKVCGIFSFFREKICFVRQRAAFIVGKRNFHTVMLRKEKGRAYTQQHALVRYIIRFIR